MIHHFHITVQDLAKYLSQLAAPLNFSIMLSMYITQQRKHFLSSINGATADSFVGVREFVRLSDAYVRMCVGARCPSFRGLYCFCSLMSCHDNTQIAV